MLTDLNLLWWILAVIILVIISYFLARRSMKDFEELPPVEHSYSLFLIRNLGAITPELAQRIHTQNEYIFSFERLNKGGEQVVALFMPSSYAPKFRELNLLEIEDYLVGDGASKVVGKVSKDKSFILLLGVKGDPKLNINVREVFNGLELKEDELLSFQIVLAGDSKQTNLFQTTIRCLISNTDPVKRIEIAKKLMGLIENQNTGLTVQNKEGTAPFEGFLRRTYVPKEVAKSVLSLDDILRLLK